MATVLATVAVLISVPAALAVPGAATAGSAVCQVRDSRLTEISGMVATDTGYVVVNDSADEASRRRIFFLNSRCAVVRSVPYPSRPRDTEDLAVDPDGTLWVADVGDNRRTRDTVAVWRLSAGGDRPVLFRMAYPDGPHDAEALLITGDGRPLIVTKQAGSAGLYAPAAPLRRGTTAPLARVGQVSLPGTRTSNPYSWVGRSVVTGAATSPDRRRVVLRTYADAYEFDVSDGDVVTALTTGTPRTIPLPDEPQGESVTYHRDGRSLLTVSETADQPTGTRPTILAYPLTTAEPGTTPGPAATSRPGPADSPAPGADTATARPAGAEGPTSGGATDDSGGDGAGRRRGAGSLILGILGLGLVVLLVAAVSRARRTGAR